MSKKIFNAVISTAKLNFEVPANETILDSGLRHGIAMHHECRNGTCGTCIATLISGDIKKMKHHDFVLSELQKDNNDFLMCCHSPQSDIEIQTQLIGSVDSIALQSIECKVVSIEHHRPELIILRVRTPRSKTLQFMAGQDVLLSVDKVNFSRFTIASCPCDGMDLEFHIFNNQQEQYTNNLFSDFLSPRDLLYLEGPKGQFILNETSKKPITLIAWETGFAAIRSIIEHFISLEMSNAISFYWMFSDINELPYQHNYASSWKAVLDDYQYHPISCHLIRDFAHCNEKDCEALSKELFQYLDPSLINSCDVYLAAPAEIVIALSEILIENGLNEQQLIASPC